MSGTVDTSPYSLIKGPGSQPPPIASPFSFAQQAQEVQHTGLENNQLMLEQHAKQSIGAAYQQSIDPQTGQVDEDKMLGIVGADPSTAYLLQGLRSAQLAQKLQQQQITQTQLGNMHDTLGLISQTMTPLLDKPDLNVSDLWNTAREISAIPGSQAYMPIENVVAGLSKLPPNASPDELRTFVAGHMATTDIGINAVKMLRPNYQTVTTAQGTKFIDVNPQTAGQAGLQTPGVPGAMIGQGLTPGESLGTQPAMVNGVQMAVPQGARAAAAGIPGAGQVTPGPGGVVAPGLGGQGPLSSAIGARPPPAEAPGSSVAPVAQAPLVPPQAATAGPTPATVPSSGPVSDPKIWNPTFPKPDVGDVAKNTVSGAFQTQPTPNQLAVQADQAKQWVDSRGAANSDLERQRQLDQLLQQEDQALDQLRTGPGTEAKSKVASTMQAIANWIGPDTEEGKGLLSAANNFMKQQGSNTELANAADDFFKKTSFQQAALNHGQLFGGTGTQAEFEQAQDAAPTLPKNLPAIKSIYNIVHQLYGYSEAKNNGAQVWEDRANEAGVPLNYNDFSTKWMNHAQATGFGGVPVESGGVVTPPGNAQQLGQGTGTPPPGPRVVTPPAGAVSPAGLSPHAKFVDPGDGHPAWFDWNATQHKWVEAKPNG